MILYNLLYIPYMYNSAANMEIGQLTGTQTQELIRSWTGTVGSNVFVMSFGKQGLGHPATEM